MINEGIVLIEYCWRDNGRFDDDNNGDFALSARL